MPKADERWAVQSYDAPYRVAAHEPLVLGDPSTVWVVCTGSLAVFSAAMTQDEQTGARRYLFAAGTGDILFGASHELTKRSLIAVPLTETVFVNVSADRLHDFCDVLGLDARAVVEAWVRRLRSAAPGRTEDASGVASADDGLWPEVDRTRLAEEMALIGAFPDLLEYARRSQDRLMEEVARAEAHECSEWIDRSRQRLALAAQMTEDALDRLAGIVKDRPSQPSREGPPLLRAVRALMQAQGIDPGRTPNLDEIAHTRTPLETILTTAHIRSRRVRLPERWWVTDAGPMLAFLAGSLQPVALMPVSPTKYELFDPVTETRSRVTRELAATLEPEAVVLYAPLPTPARRPVELIRFALRGRWRDVAVIGLAGLASTLLGMLVPQSTVVLVDRVLPDANRTLLVQLGLGLTVAAVARTLFELTLGVALLRIESTATTLVQSSFWDRLLKLRPGFFRQYSIGDLAARVNSVSAMREQLSSATVKGLLTSVVSLLNLALMFYYSARLGLIALFAGLVTVAVTTAFGVATLRRLRPLLLLQGRIVGVTVQLVNAIAKLRVAGAEQRAFAHWSAMFGRQQVLRRDVQRTQDAVKVFNVMMPALTWAALFTVAAVAIREPTAGTAPLSLGAFLAFHIAFGTFMGSSALLSTTLVELLDVANLWERAVPLLEAEPEVTHRKADPGRLSGRVALAHVTFRYRQGGSPVLDDVSVHADPGEFVAIVGASGSGKSTLMRLLLGFEEPRAGTITYDGQDLSGLDVHAVRRQIGVVLQNSRLLSASIFENIAAGARVSHDRAWEAAQLAGLEQDVREMPMGMNTHVSEGGSNLSGGQRQRLLIARALLHRPRLLLLDEATSALDNRTQTIVTASLEALYVTRIVIAHRLSTIRNAHRIYVVERGRIAQQGTFDELAGQPGVFRELIARQLL